jgi:excisionase family DNA binding protein
MTTPKGRTPQAGGGSKPYCIRVVRLLTKAAVATTMNGTELLTADELAARLHLRPSTIRRWRREGRIPAVRPTPKVVRYDLAEVVRAMREGQRPQGVAHE